MKNIKQVFYLIIVLLLSVSSLNAQSTAANAGKEFYIAYLRNYQTSTLQLKVVVEHECYITAQYNNQPSVYWNNWNNTLVSPGIYTANVSYNDMINLFAAGSGEITSRTITLTSTEDVCVYVINYRNFSSDATCVLPVPTWGTEYRLATGVPMSGYSSAYAIVASENNTEVTLHDNSSIMLDKNEVYHFLGAYNIDMTGERVSATKPVGLFSGTNSSYGGRDPHYGCSGAADYTADHTYEQLWSVDKWGKEFFAFPISTPGTYNWGGMLALVAHENGTHITLSGDINGEIPLYYALNAGEKQYVCQVMSGLTKIESDKPIMVFLILPDACVISILPADQRIHHALVAPFILIGGTNINNHGIDMLIPAAYWDQTVIKHDGVVVSNSLYYTVNTSTHFKDWYHVRRNLTNVDITIDITCPGGFLAYISGNGSGETYAFCAGVGAYDLQNYFTIQEKGTTIDTYYENTTEETHTFEPSDIIVVKRTVESSFDMVLWLINGVPYSISENSNTTNTLYFPATALHSGENTITMSVHYTGASQDSLYTGKVWLFGNTEFYVNDIPSQNLPDTTICTKDVVHFRAEIEGLNPNPGSLKWFINGAEETDAQDQIEWSKSLPTGTHGIKMWALINNKETVIETVLKVELFWIKMRNVTH